MTYVLNNAELLPAAEAQRAAPAREGLLSRIFTAIINSRLRSAERELRARHLMLNEAGIVMGGIPFATVAADDKLPFNR
ncbi:hypothetical protein [Bosea sp. (in: a-proteobacteria)]|uniref:hypothetical protein n=1 Tax=Bosea sp. (in: a-proteobacteria) TaxID=1871050 RepID=UPI003B3A18F6